MQHRHLRFENGFRLAFRVGSVQAAEMVIAPGDSEGGPDNRHSGADQWLYVVAGTGVATVEGKPQSLEPGCLLVVERGESHQIRNTGRTLLKTLNLYSPAAYVNEDEELPAGKS